MNYFQACQAIVDNRKEKSLNYAVNYARAGLDLNDHENQRVQALYILNNMSRWRGDLARLVRAALKQTAGVK